MSSFWNDIWILQASFSTLGSGILDSSYLARPGGLVFPDGDGRVEANSLAAAIYGVAIPSRFNDFVQSDNYFGRNNHNNQDNGGIFTPDFSVYSGRFNNDGAFDSIHRIYGILISF